MANTAQARPRGGGASLQAPPVGGRPRPAVTRPYPSVERRVSRRGRAAGRAEGCRALDEKARECAEGEAAAQRIQAHADEGAQPSRPKVVCVATRGAASLLTRQRNADVWFVDTDAALVADAGCKCWAVLPPDAAADLEGTTETTPEIARALAALMQIDEAHDAPLVIVAGLSGGGLGAGTACHLAAAAAAAGRPVYACVATPFAFEGPRKRKAAAAAAADLRRTCRAVLEVDSNALGDMAPTVAETAKVGDATLAGAANAVLVMHNAGVDLRGGGAVAVASAPVPLPRSDADGDGVPPAAQLVTTAGRKAAQQAAAAPLLARAWDAGAVMVAASVAAPGVPDYAETLRASDVAAKGALATLLEETEARGADTSDVSAHASLDTAAPLDDANAEIRVVVVVACAPGGLLTAEVVDAEAAEAAARRDARQREARREKLRAASRAGMRAQDEQDDAEKSERGLSGDAGATTMERIDEEDASSGAGVYLDYDDAPEDEEVVGAIEEEEEEEEEDEEEPKSAAARARGILGRDRIENAANARRDSIDLPPSLALSNGKSSVTHRFPDNSLYEGTWGHDGPEGKGTLRAAPPAGGVIYRGSWVAGERSGFGVGLYAGLGTFEGSWEADKPHGSGVAKLDGGGRVEGSWRHGLMHGMCLVEKSRRGKKTVYRGPFRDGVEHGDGVRTTEGEGGGVFERWFKGKLTESRPLTPSEMAEWSRYARDERARGL